MMNFVDTVLGVLAMQVRAALMPLDMDAMCDPVEEAEMQESLRGIDDVSGDAIDPVFIQRARQEEMAGFRQRKVYSYVPRGEAESDYRGAMGGS